MAASAFVPQALSTAPNAPPATASSRLSVKSWRMRLARVAPMAVRTAISRWRPSARESRRLATLAHAMSSTNPTAEENPQRRTDARDQLVAQIADAHGGAGVCIREARMLAAILRGQRIHLRLRLRERYAGLQPRQEIQKSRAAVELHRCDDAEIEYARHDYVHRAEVIEAEARGQHAGDGVDLVVESERLAQRRRARAASPRPK